MTCGHPVTSQNFQSSFRLGDLTANGHECICSHSIDLIVISISSGSAPVKRNAEPGFERVTHFMDSRRPSKRKRGRSVAAKIEVCAFLA